MTSTPTLPPLPDLGTILFEIGPIEFELKNADMIKAIYNTLRLENAIRDVRLTIAKTIYTLGPDKALTADTTERDVLGPIRVSRRHNTESEGAFVDWRIASFYDTHRDGPAKELNASATKVLLAKADATSLAEGYERLVLLCAAQKQQTEWMDAALNELLEVPDDVDSYTAISTSGSSGWRFVRSESHRLLTIDYRTYE